MFKDDRGGTDEDTRVPMVAATVTLAIRVPRNNCNHCQLLYSTQFVSFSTNHFS